MIVQSSFTCILELKILTAVKCLKIKFTTANSSYGGSCGGEGGASHYQSEELELSPGQRGDMGEVAMVTISLARGLEHHQGHELYYICVQASSYY